MSALNGPGTEPLLRPLGLGELLDRAVTLCVKYFVPLALIFVVYAIPLAIVQYFAGEDLGHVLSQLAVPAGGRSSDPQAVMRSLGSVRTNGWYAWLVLFSLLLGPLPTAALIWATTRTYLGHATTFAEAYRVALRRWLPLIGINILYVLALGVVYVALVLVLAAIFVGLAFLTVALRGVGIGLDLLIGFVALFAMIAFFVVAVLAFQMSYFTCVVEDAGAVTSLRRGISRVFVGVGLKRSLLFGAVFFAIGIGITLVDTIGASVLDALFRSAIPGAVYSTLVRVGTAAFTTAFIGIFYYDLRVREEGFDLQLAAQSVAQGPTLAT